ncbi:MAG TPA: SpoIIE family protein phosphatase [Candidatus Polarisedimenticolia bacterium]|nr:SpoIIE family protein phosphatase [Candidatus Polarisedimenticolia bacterium]
MGRKARLAALALLFLLAGGHQARYAVDAVEGLRHAATEERLPFEAAARGDVRATVISVQPEAEAAGLARGDRIAAVQGTPATGASVLPRALAGLRAGDTLRLTLEDGRDLSIVLAAKGAPADAGTWALGLLLHVVTPWLCLALGFWAAASRDHDPLAWLLLALLISFSQVLSAEVLHWPGLLASAGTFHKKLGERSWGIWMLLFGVFFPQRLDWDRRWPWCKWIFIAPLAAASVLSAMYGALWSWSYAAAATLSGPVNALSIPSYALSMTAIALFFMSLGYKSGTTTSPDARRRLVLLHTGATISMTPAFIASLAGLVQRREPFQAVGPWFGTVAVLLFCLFPFTLAYVIVVHRAMDVRVVLRQGVRYAFARGGAAALGVVLMITIILATGLAAGRPDRRRVEVVTIVALGALSMVLLARLGQRIMLWIDRRFFRDAYDAERILGDLSEKVRAFVQTAPLLETVARTLSESLHVARVAVLLEDGGAYRPAHTLGYAGAPEVSFAQGSRVVAALREGRSPLRVYLDDPSSWLMADGVPAEERSALGSLESQLLLPLAAGPTLPGFVCLGPKRSEEPYSGSDLRLLQSVATQTALALENGRLTEEVAREVARRERLNREVEIAREVQERLFPQHLPPVQGLDYAGFCRPAMGVGGDYYDFLALEGGRLGVAVADISGKGIGAALLMASLQASLRGQTMLRQGSIGRMMAAVNRLVHAASPDNRYATFFYSEFDPATRRLAYVNAGHCPPIILRTGPEGRRVIRLAAGGTVIGLFEEATFTEKHLDLAPGDLLVAFTDGISEAMNEEEEEWGDERLIEAMASRRGLGAGDLVQALLGEADRFAGAAPQHDDMTLVAMRVL